MSKENPSFSPDSKERNVNDKHTAWVEQQLADMQKKSEESNDGSTIWTVALATFGAISATRLPEVLHTPDLANYTPAVTAVLALGGAYYGIKPLVKRFLKKD
jgi:predicted metal-dependent hydrolase